MVGADEVFGRTFVRTTNAGAAVTAIVQQHADLAFFIQHRNDRILAHIGLEKRTRLLELIHVCDEQPAAGEDAPHFLAVDRIVRKDPAIDEPAIGVDHAAHIKV